MIELEGSLSGEWLDVSLGKSQYVYLAGALWASEQQRTFLLDAGGENGGIARLSFDSGLALDCYN